MKVDFYPAKGRCWRLICAAVCLSILAGCATGPKLARTEVTAFNEWSTMPVDRTYTFARTLEFQNSLELQSYEVLVRDELGLQGFRLVSDPAQANLVVTLRPSISGTNVRLRDRWSVDPFFGPYGFYGSRRLGWSGPFGYGGFGAYYGGFYNGFDDDSIQIFQRRLELDIDSRATAGKRYYEGRVESAGPNGTLSRIMPVLVRALFTEFPGNNGQTRQVDVPIVRAPDPGK